MSRACFNGRSKPGDEPARDNRSRHVRWVLNHPWSCFSSKLKGARLLADQIRVKPARLKSVWFPPRVSREGRHYRRFSEQPGTRNPLPAAPSLRTLRKSLLIRLQIKVPQRRGPVGQLHIHRLIEGFIL